jgi:hypothetical protein
MGIFHSYVKLPEGTSDYQRVYDGDRTNMSQLIFENTTNMVATNSNFLW